MSYSTIDDMKARVPERLLMELTQADPSLGTIDESKITTAIEDADKLIDFYLAPKYEVPFVSIPGIINQISINIARYNLYKFKYDVECPGSVVAVYKEAVKLLEQLKTGSLELTGADLQDDSSGDFVVVTNIEEDDIMYDEDTLDMI